jgi:pyridoxal phosphate enzyme (YggS family)
VPRLVTGLDAAKVRDNLERAREAIAAAGRDPGEVDILAAVKYVPADEIETLREAGLTLLGENRAQDLEEKATRFPGFRWHFIGALQSRKVKQIVPYVELIHSVASESALRQLERHGTADTRILLEVNIAGEEGKAGIAPDELPRYLELSPVEVVGLMTMPPFADDPEASRPHFARLAELAAEHGLSELSMGTSQDYAVAAAEGATIVRIGTTLYA